MIISTTSPVDFGPSEDAAAGAAASVDGAGAAPSPSSITQTKAPISRFTPSSALILKIPDVSAFSSNVALSDSNFPSFTS